MSGKRKIFFSGIGGSGMSAIACFMSDRGHGVSGSDRAFDQNPNHPVFKLLKKKGIRIVPQDGSGLDKSFDLAVFSTAVEADRPEAVRANELGLPVKTRPEFLAEIVDGFKTIAVAGTSGKSTASGMLAFLMKELGLNPNFIGGGRVRQFKSESNPGNSITGSSESLVIEACESDGTIVNYKPAHSIILNLDFDHHSVAATGEMFRALIKNTKEKVLINSDDAHLKGILPKGAVTFSIDASSDYRAEDVCLKPLGSGFTVRGVRFGLSLPGRYNIHNALSSIAFLSESGAPLSDISQALSDFKGIERRFDVVLDDGERLVIDDYAHNPHKIASFMKAVSALRGDICYVFQPHGYGPTKMMKDEYISAFAENLRRKDRLIIFPIFFAGGTAVMDISSEDLAQGVREAGKSAVSADREEVLMRVKEFQSYVIMGARDETLSDFAREIAENL